MQTIHGEYMKTVQCNFQVQTKQMADYCFVFRVVDDRCHKNTFWTPSNVNEIIPCIWIKRKYKSKMLFIFYLTFYLYFYVTNYVCRLRKNFRKFGTYREY